MRGQEATVLSLRAAAISVPSELQASNTVWADIGADAAPTPAAPTSVPSERSDIENAVPSTEYQYKGGHW
jgi:hypothetical protein